MHPEWTLTAEQIAALPLDDLALEVLRDADASREWNSYNWLQTASSVYEHGTGRILAEAWQWLWSRGMVAGDPRQSSHAAFFITRRGREALEHGLAPARAEDLLGQPLHPALESKARRQFLLGEFDLAAFAAMRQVEMRLRELAPPDTDDFGVRLVGRVLGDDGTIQTPALPEPERNARRALFAGALGFFKNPASHREVEFDEPRQAAEVVLLADLLLRILDAAERETEADRRPIQ